jgi:hypothetical protein
MLHPQARAMFEGAQRAASQPEAPPNAGTHRASA